MWARIPITGLMGDIPVEEWPQQMATHQAQPWDCPSHTHSVYVIDRATPAPWLAKIDGEMYPAKYLFTVDYTDSEIADDPAQHKQSHVMCLLDAGEWTGNIVALPNNRVRVTHPAWFVTGEGAPDFKPSAQIHYSKSDWTILLMLTKYLTTYTQRKNNVYFCNQLSKQFEKDYGLPMLESVVNKWKPDFKLYVYLEGYEGKTDSLPQVALLPIDISRM